MPRRTTIDHARRRPHDARHDAHDARTTPRTHGRAGARASSLRRSPRTDSPWLDHRAADDPRRSSPCVAGYLNAAPFKIELVRATGSSRRSASSFPRATAPVQVGQRRCRRSSSSPPGSSSAWRSARRCTATAASTLKGLTQRNRCSVPGYTLPGQQVLPRRPLREGHRARHRPPDRRRPPTGSTSTSSTASSTRVGIGGRKTGDWVYRNVDQRRGRRRGQRQRRRRARNRRRPAAGAVRQGQPVRSAAVRCRSRRRARARHRQHLEEPHGRTLTTNNWLLSVGTFLPLAGVLVMLFIPKREEPLIKRHRARHGGGHAGASASSRWRSSTTARPSKLQFFATNDVDQADQGDLHDRPRRHQPAAVHPVDGHHPAGDDLLVGPHARRRATPRRSSS